ncbi:hypothetical protein C2S51_006995 [Perilla frutescens var. frutescens]|nr:hypothetical protein C2S51_006995 [Perilla frutescens var. frutescens]
MIEAMRRANVEEYLEDTMDRFLAGLRRAIRERVALYHFKELEDMVEYAIWIEKWLKELEMKSKKEVQVESNIELPSAFIAINDNFTSKVPILDFVGAPIISLPYVPMCLDVGEVDVVEESKPEMDMTETTSVEMPVLDELVQDDCNQEESVSIYVDEEVPILEITNLEKTSIEDTVHVEFTMEVSSMEMTSPKDCMVDKLQIVNLESIVAVEEIEVVENMLELQPCSQKEDDIILEMDVAQAAKDVPHDIDVPPDLFVIPMSMHPMKLKLE